MLQTLVALFKDQLIDPFRIVMLVALVHVWRRNRGTGGGVFPLALGYVFVAVLLALTMGPPGLAVPGILAGLVSNAVILAVILGLWTLWQRRGRS